MKNIILLLILFSVSVIAKPVDTLFEEANNAYSNKNYSDAINLYEEVLDSGYVSSELYYNLGNAYFKKDNIAFAILNYERADKLSNDADIDYNLKIANLKTIDKIDPLPQIFIFNWIDSLRGLFTSSTWSLITIVFFTLFLLSIGFIYASKSISLKKFLFIDMVFTFILFVISFYMAYSAYQIEYVNEYGIVTTPSSYVKSSPDTESRDLFILHEGTKFEILDEVGNWRKIELESGEVGWLNIKTFRKI